MEPSQLLQYLYDCYLADNQGSSFWNLSDKKVEFARVFEGKEQILSEELGHMTLDNEYANATFLEAYQYAKEKELLYGHLYLIGKTKVKDKDISICAPLFLYPAKIVFKNADTPDEVAFLQLEHNSRRINYSLIQAITEDPEIAASIYEELSMEIPQGPVDYSTLSVLENVLRDQIPEVSFRKMFLYPELLPHKEVNRLFGIAKRRKTSLIDLVPASSLTLVPKSRQIRGVLTELEELAKSKNLATPLRILLGAEKNVPVSETVIKANSVPAVLSKAQTKVLEKASNQALTLVVGPPGTGKSFTISALALETVSRGERVLIASKMDHAVDVIGKKIEDSLGVWGAAVRGGKKQYYKELVKDLDNLLNGIRAERKYPNLSVYKAKLEDLDETIAKDQKILNKKIRFEMKWGKFLAKERKGRKRFHLLRNLKRLYLNKQVQNLEELSQHFGALHFQTQEKISVLKSYLIAHFHLRREMALKKDRNTIQNFVKGIRSRSANMQEMYFDDVEFSQLLFAFPIWLVNLSAIHKVLPFEQEMFDLLIIDESTQCDIASCLPLIQRAKRVVIVGDPKQLRHISFLSRVQQASFAKENKLTGAVAESYSYRDKSILDVASEVIGDQENIIFLDEHFRSLPDIIRFSNQEFYGCALRVMKGNPLARRQRNLDLIKVEGQRTEKGYNPKEAQRLIGDVKALVLSQKHLKSHLKHSIGILSPFRDQVDFLADLLKKEIKASEIQEHRIMLGTAHSFQGEERDIMFLSLALDPESHPNSFHYLNRPDLFNVSITRARNLQQIYTSLSPGDLKPDTLLHRYLTFLSSDASYTVPLRGQQQHDQFLQEVCEVFEEMGGLTWPEYPLAGLEIDLVVELNGKVLGFDLVGFPGKFAPAFSLERYEMLQRSGLPIVPLSFVYWEYFRENCIRDLQALFDGKTPHRDKI